MKPLERELATMRGLAACRGDDERLDEADAELSRLRKREKARDEGFAFGKSQFEPTPVAWMTYGACTGEPVFSTDPPDDVNLAGRIPLYRKNADCL